MRKKAVIFILGAMLTVAGCVSPKRPIKKICPGKGSVAEALAALGAQALKAVPLRASGQCRLELPVEGLVILDE